MGFERLKQHICDMILEQQLKLGYREETIRLYYLLPSLNRLLETKADVQGMRQILLEFAAYVADDLGEVGFSFLKDSRIGFVLPPQAGSYVKEKEQGTKAMFLKDFLAVICRHDAGLDAVEEIFHKYSDQVHAEDLAHEDFDRLIYFEEGVPDDYRYCITQEGPHLSYHRFTADDFAAEFMTGSTP
ncbi:MAG: DUF3877 family protein [Clostridiales bacterium]|nr:DUF3877 family protein [Clostridiales bacterium]